MANFWRHRSPDRMCWCHVHLNHRQPSQIHRPYLFYFALHQSCHSQLPGSRRIRHFVPGRHVSPSINHHAWGCADKFRYSGTAAGLAGTARLLFGAVATAIFGNVTNGKYASQLSTRVAENVAQFNFPAANLKALAAAAKLNTAAAFKAVPGITPQIQAAAAHGNKEAYLDGAHLSYQVALAFGLLGCIAALFIPSIDSRKYTKKTVALQEADRKAIIEKKDVHA